MVIAAGSVINDPKSGPMVNITNQPAAGVPPKNFTNRLSRKEVKSKTGLVEATTMTTITKMGSMNFEVGAESFPSKSPPRK